MQVLGMSQIPQVPLKSLGINICQELKQAYTAYFLFLFDMPSAQLLAVQSNTAMYSRPTPAVNTCTAHMVMMLDM